MSKVISCGTCIFHHNYLLVCHVKGQWQWDIPKGVQEVGESYYETAKRELYEETGLILPDEGELYNHGLYRYTKRKNLYIYEWRIQSLDYSILCPLHCSIGLCEFDDFRFVPIQSLEHYVTQRMYNILKVILTV